MRAIADYLALVPPEHAGKPNFTAELALILQPFSDLQVLLESLPSLFDLDLAVGVQLDATGEWIGRSRNIPVPVPNAWFSFGVQGLGWGQGYWKGPLAGETALSSLDDDTYRRLLRAVILANQSNGLAPDIQACLSEYFNNSQTNIFVVDETDRPLNSLWFSFGDARRGWGRGYWFTPEDSLGSASSADLAMWVGLSGLLPSIVDLEILYQLLIPFKPAGVRIDWAITTVSGSPVFGFGLENKYVSGFGVGAWGRDPDWVAQNVVL